MIWDAIDRVRPQLLVSRAGHTRADGIRPGDTRLVAEAVEVANDSVGVASNGYDEVWAGDTSPSVDGPVIDFDSPLNADDELIALTNRWLDLLADALADRGWRGTVTHTDNHHQFSPAWGRHDDPGRNWLTAFAAYQLDPSLPLQDSSNRFRWGLEPALARAVLIDTVTAGQTGGVDDTHIRLGQAATRVNDPEVTDLLLDALDETQVNVEVSHSRYQPLHVLKASTNYDGRMTWQVLRADLDWVATINELRPMLLAHADRLDIAFIRSCPSPVPSFSLNDKRGYGLPGIAGYLYDSRQTRYAWADLLPDIHGIQIVTRSQLDNAGDLTGWTLTTLDPGHWLLEADDLGPWYSTDIPDHDTLQQARRTHRDMIMQPDAARPGT